MPKPKLPPMRKVYILPNLFTAGSLFCGLLAIFEVFDQGDFVQAIHYILIGGVLDVLDGLIARLTKTQSAFGLNFDSLADLVSFGVAPAVVVYNGIVPEFPLLAKATCGLFVVCGALRLARFNVQAAKEEKKSFLGLPIPGAACCAISLYWFLSNNPAISHYFPSEKMLPPAMVLLAALMVSQFQYYGLKSLRVTGRQSFEILVSIVIVLALLLALKQHIDVILFAICGPYVLSGPSIYFIQRIRGEALRNPAAAGTASFKSAQRHPQRAVAAPNDSGDSSAR
ncbi:CDP-diacylglycerol--serine O-phosphatidyltransferase [Candidatus Sumerlaeota bacterium]|nr:CDP-diacylglycerol--serine O-phosphatidyltransferase [Candidatus Sumerlaeota bacterium]